MRESALHLVTESPPWWRTLPEDFYCQSDGTELDSEYPVKVYGSAAIDRVLRSGLGAMVTAAMLPKLLKGAMGSKERHWLDFYTEMAEARDINQVFQPPADVYVEECKPSFFTRIPKDIPAVELCFDSPFTPLNPDITASYLSHKNNRRARALHWRHPEGPRPTMIFVHGVVESWYSVNSVFFSLKSFYDQGYDVVMFTLPFHGKRADSYRLFNGFGVFSGGFSQINEAVLHAVSDLRVLFNYLVERGTPSVGITGLSLGGYISALMAVVEHRLAFCIPNSPLVAPVDTMRGWQPTGHLLDLISQHSGITPLDLRQGMAIHSPLTYQPKLDPEKVMIIGGAGDRFTPPRFVRLMHSHWPESHLHWFPGNHMMHWGQGEYLKLMLRFMDSHCQGMLSDNEQQLYY
ncbi:Alpha/beta hydrolase family [Spongiibacter sp. IMCC21906]|jgi:pimeloyl-ACP methyl ester carboxylesterase|uniref:alpha/beta hydrolase family protein n=1 Tax=Spongiibacter sp. IMCC21906 TaxID=1620392 RepID=UPI00062DF1F1|nr:alpha/beta hydrolase [Spongiibacter sp. IMCC21906]AKH67875.1 Alpha/beta hydrolase family [Spongiibacter sp. IMCC21906]